MCSGLQRGGGADDAYEIRQVDVAIGIQEDVVGLHIAMYNALAVDISQSAAQLSYPEAHGILCESLSGDVEP